MAATELRIAVHPLYINEVQSDPEKLKAMIACKQSFREFLNYWNFIDGETGEVRILGEVLWSGQEQVIEGMMKVPKLFALKARKLGFTTMETAYDAWVARFRDENCRVHVFSRRDDAAQELIDAIEFGMLRLPKWMQLPQVKKAKELWIDAGPDDKRLIKSYPSSKQTAVEKSCTHAHVDEWARMQDPRSFWQAVEPSFAKSAHIVTTGLGPENYASVFWRDCMAGENEYVPIFVAALERPDRDKAWLDQKIRSMTEEARRQEFPMTWEDALFGGGSFTFRSVDINVAGIGIGPTRPEQGHKYVKAWDIGRHKDAAVGCVIDASRNPSQVVEYVRLRGVPYPTLQRNIERMHEKYPGLTVIEKNGPGEAVAENLDINESQILLFNTTAKSKAKIIEELQVALENRHLQWNARAWPQLDAEIRGYQIPDDNIVQDSVMSLAICNAHVSHAWSLGRVGLVEEIGQF